jgi:glycosyltransferase involved in cell wall biosynthesis
MLVNICMLAYNHEDYIIESIESILNQITDFSLLLIIGEDKSTDRTREICMEYADRFPDKIKLITSVSNVGMMQNFVRTYKACEGKYIAFCEGDDYWTDPYKLQKQVDFLEANPEYSGCFHNVKIKMDSYKGEHREWVLHNSLPKDTFNTEDVLGPWFIASPSVVFVNYTDFVLPDWFFNCVYGDLPYILLLTLRGNFKYIDEVMAVYRKHDKGLSEVHKAYDKVMLMIYIYVSFNIYSNFKFHKAVRKAVEYEIDTHIPQKIVEINKEETVIFYLKKYYIKMKKIIYKDSLEKKGW